MRAKKQSGSICLLKDCDRDVHAKGLCRIHYWRMHRRGSTDRLYQQRTGKSCLVVGCERSIHGRGLCVRHYTRMRRHGSTDRLYPSYEQHGMSDSPQYMVWITMKKRCYNRNYDEFHNYGGRGIKVCDRWRNSFSAFYQDMGSRPTKNHQIDRINNDGDYEPDNCHWVLPRTNASNRRTTKLDQNKVDQIRKLYRAGNVTQKNLAKKFGVTRDTISKIVRGKTWRR